jgi:UDP-N-acetyl-D-glucosamine dehydrogenase
MMSVEGLDTNLRNADCVVVVTDHSTYDWPQIHRLVRLLVDTRRGLNSLQKEIAA